MVVRITTKEPLKSAPPSFTVANPARIVFEAWTKPELFKRWWVPKSFGMSFLSCEIYARTGGSYRFAFRHPSSEQPMAFFGRYIEVIPNARLVWTNEEGGENGNVTTVTFEGDDAPYNGTYRGTVLPLNDSHRTAKLVENPEIIAL